MTKQNAEDLSGGKFTDMPNEKYKKFFEKFAEIETLPISEWKPVHLIGFFAKRYKQHYNIDFSFKYNSPSPSKCFEVFQIKKLAMMLSSDPTILKPYIDWVFQNKVLQAKRRLTSISFLTDETTVQEYKMNILLGNKPTTTNIDRSTPLPISYKQIFQSIGIRIQNYGDLAFLCQMEQNAATQKAFDQLQELGFDRSIVDRIV